MIEPKIIELPKFTDPRGNLSFLENENQIPFKIARSYWIYDVKHVVDTLLKIATNLSLLSLEPLI